MTAQSSQPRVKDIQCQAEQAFWLERQARLAELCAAIESAYPHRPVDLITGRSPI